MIAVVLIGHGAPATDCPPRLVGELMGLEWRGEAPGNHSLQGRSKELDAQIRNWPRNPRNDPYKEGLEQVARALQPLLPTELFAVGYNEFCRPSIHEAVEGVISQGAKKVLVVPSMLTPGGLHSEVDIPKALEELRGRHPGVEIRYVWPFDLKEVAALLAGHIGRAVSSEPTAEPLAGNRRRDHEGYRGVRNP